MVPEIFVILSAIALLGAIGAFVWLRSSKSAGARHPNAPAATSRPVTAEPVSRDQADAGSVAERQVAADDPEVTRVFTFPLEQIRSMRNGSGSVDAESERDSRDAAPTVTAETAGANLDDYASRVKLNFEADAELEEVTSPMIRILLSAAGASDRGLRRKNNEDSLLVLRERSIFAVADGMGGYAGGEMASALAVDVLRDAFERSVFEARAESDIELPRRGRELACAIQMANTAIYAIAENDPQLHNMGTTIVAARFSANKQRVYVAHVGDSRCYRLRGSILRQLTMDHTMSALGMTGPHSKDLFQAVGVKPTMVIDLIVDKPLHDDLYLLCSDGLSKMLSDEEMLDVLLLEPDLDAAVRRLIELANQHGGRDNITLILVKVVERIPRESARRTKTVSSSS